MFLCFSSQRYSMLKVIWAIFSVKTYKHHRLKQMFIALENLLHLTHTYEYESEKEKKTQTQI